MSGLELASFALNMIGLVLTATGAFLAANAVMIDPTQAALGSVITSADSDNPTRGLLAQNARARNGLLWVAVGTVAQINALCLALAK